ncbi:hypothetical protein PT300_12920 [Enterobacteriaceae bacterium ESL0689]|nr:hypothetical protein [Enterobacteriaceae bacterium ESL0689]
MAIPVYLWLKDDGGADIRQAACGKHHHLEQIARCYEKITRVDKEYNIMHFDCWNQRTSDQRTSA